MYHKGGKVTINQTFYDCILHAIKGQPVPMDIVRIYSETKVYYSFLSFSWGLLADIDIESECLRCCGEKRFSYWAIYRSIFPRKHSGTLSYCHKDNSFVEIAALNSSVPDSWTTVTGEFLFITAAYVTHLSSSVLFSPESTLDDETIYLFYVKADVSFYQVLQFLLKMENGLHIKLPYVHTIPVKAFRFVPDDHKDIMTIDGERIHCCPVQAEIIPKMANILLRNT